MLKIFNSIGVFFEDCYREVSVREYARLSKISPPTASKLLSQLKKEGLLIFKKERNCLIYRANRENQLFIDISKAYWRQRLSLLTEMLSRAANHETIILFGSLIKGETAANSDIDIFINCSLKEINLKGFEKSLKRKIQLHFKPELRNDKLKKNIQLGLLLYGAVI